VDSSAHPQDRSTSGFLRGPAKKSSVLRSTPVAALATLLCGRLGGADQAAIERALVDGIARARAAWPEVELDPEAFVVELGRRLPAETDPLAALAGLRIEELWLTCAAAAGDGAAVARIDALYFGRAKAALRGIDGGAALAEEALQRVREALFLGKPGRSPRIAGYAGRGELDRWIRTAAMRAAIDLLAPTREVSVRDETLASFGLAADDPAVAMMKSEYGESFAKALRDTMAALPRQTRDELRHYYLEGLRLEQIAALYGVAASTVSRRLEKARRALLDGTRAAMAERLGVGADEIDSILRLIETRLELARSAIVGAEGPRGG
jgi:RNA polymerase sigma-70 factor (ECF subfamily)